MDFLNDCAFITERSPFTNKSKKQHTSLEANLSRCVTNVRWVVEAVNDRLKKWKFLDHVVQNNHIPYIGDLVRIVASLLDKYKPPIKTNDDEYDNLTRNMRLACALRFHGRSKTWKAIDAQDLQVAFPVLSLDHLRNLTIGIYQLKSI